MRWLDQRMRRRELRPYFMTDLVTRETLQESMLWMLVAPSMSIDPRIDLIAEFEGRLVLFRGEASKDPRPPACPADCVMVAHVLVPGVTKHCWPSFVAAAMR